MSDFWPPAGGKHITLSATGEPHRIISEPVPTVGRIVHYVSHGTPPREDGTQAYTSECRAAIVTEVPECLVEEPYDGCPNGANGIWLAHLAVLNPTGMFFTCDVTYDPSQTAGTWHWPEAGAWHLPERG